MSNPTIQISFIKAFPSVKEGIFDLTGISKNQLKKYQLNKKFLEKEVVPQMSVELPLALVNDKRINPVYTGDDQLKIIYDDENIFCFIKPPKVHSHPLSYLDTKNCLSGFYQLGKGKLLEVNSDSYDRGLMYRLDYETSGVMVYLKKEDLYRTVRKDFERLAKSKSYLAIVSGRPLFDELTHKLKAAGPKGHKMIPSQEGVESHLSFEVLEFSKKRNQSLLKIFLKEGHRHQIRSQLSHAGFPILGDELYGGENADRLYLHSYSYAFHLNDKDYIITDESDPLSKLFDGN